MHTLIYGRNLVTQDGNLYNSTKKYPYIQDKRKEGYKIKPWIKNTSYVT